MIKSPPFLSQSYNPGAFFSPPLQNLLSSNLLIVLKHKKILALCLLFFITTGIIFPQIAYAGVFGGAGWGAAIGCGAGIVGSVAFGFFTGGLGWATVPVAAGACWAGTKIGAVVGAGTSIATG